MAGDAVILLGRPATTLGGSQYYYALRNKIMGPCPALDLAAEKALQDFLLDMISQGMVASAQDVSEGGLGAAIAECAMLSEDGLGARINLEKNIHPAIELFSDCLLYTSPSPRDRTRSRMPSSA